MNDQPLPTGPADGHNAGAAGEPYARPRQGYVDPGGSESTRGLRDTARRRRDAEEKLQQHLIEAKEHVPNEHHGNYAAMEGHPTVGDHADLEDHAHPGEGRERDAAGESARGDHDEPDARQEGSDDGDTR